MLPPITIPTTSLSRPPPLQVGLLDPNGAGKSTTFSVAVPFVTHPKWHHYHANNPPPLSYLIPLQVGLLGPNGAGKSTTFSIAVGRETPTAGAVRLGGADVTGLPLERRARMGVAFLAQEASIFRGLSVADNIRLVLEEGPLPYHLHDARIEELLRKFDLVHVAHTMGRHLSGGERRRAEVARALAVKDSDCNPPRLLMVDEPFAGVDPIGVQLMQSMLCALREQDAMAILITDHNVAETLGVCDRAYVMHEGRVVACGTPEQVLEDPLVQRFYLGSAFARQAVL
ncbi:unnamed protein product [Closterium sp. NIES-64]|nr:unnamed protein product [Closterium sp. NIES-64]